MKIAEINLTNKEVLERWNTKEQVFSCELGGLGPGYEQALQEAVFKLFDFLETNKIELKLLVDEKKKEFSSRYEEISLILLGNDGLSGAQAGAAKATAFRFYKYGYANMMQKAPKDRLIIVSKTV